IGLVGASHQKTLPVGTHVIAGDGAAAIEIHVEQLGGCRSGESLARIYGNAVDAAAIPVEEFFAVMAPARLLPALGRNLPAAGAPAHSLHKNLTASCFAGSVSHVVAVRRETAF